MTNLAVHFSSVKDTWTTPRDLFNKLDTEFGFTLDACALACSALCPQWYGPDHTDPLRRDCLVTDWVTDARGGAIFMNPPYGRVIGAFMAKANNEAQRGARVVCLVPSRTDTNWFHNYAIHWEVRYLRGRLKFGDAVNSAPFPSAIVVMSR